MKGVDYINFMRDFRGLSNTLDRIEEQQKEVLELLKAIELNTRQPITRVTSYPPKSQPRCICDQKGKSTGTIWCPIHDGQALGQRWARG